MKLENINITYSLILINNMDDNKIPFNIIIMDTKWRVSYNFVMFGYMMFTIDKYFCNRII